MSHAVISPRASTYFKGDALTEGFDFRISGIFKPNLELMLDPGVAFYTERGSTLSRSRGDRFGLGTSYFPTILGTGLGMVNRMIGGGASSWLLTKYTNHNDKPRSVTVTAPVEGNLVAINLDEAGGSIMCKRKSFFGMPYHGDKGMGNSIRAGWGIDLQLWHWLGVPSLAFGERTFLWQQIRAPKSREHFQQAVDYRLPELPSKEPDAPAEEEAKALPSKNWVFLHAPGDVIVKDLTPDDPFLAIKRGSLMAITPHTRRGAWFTKSGIVSNAINLGPQNDGETFLSPTFTTRGNDILNVKGPCRLWVAETPAQEM